MIVLLRIDDRLLHGQVAVSWTSYLGADTILVANDRAASDSLLQMACKAARPPEVTLSIKSVAGGVAVINNPKHAARRIFVIVSSAHDAARIVDECPEVRVVCIGGMRKAPDKKQVERQVFLDDEDMAAFERIREQGREVYLQTVPTEKRMTFDQVEQVYER